MTAQAIIEQVTADGVQLALSVRGGIKASGDQEAVNRWIPIIRENKADIMAALAPDDWLAAWREVAELTSGLTADDPRLPIVMDALLAWDEAIQRGNWVAFRLYTSRVRSAMAGEQCP
ncbi:MAG: hypothetical protein ABIU05_13240 [Nitrospirales bacterium]